MRSDDYPLVVNPPTPPPPKIATTLEVFIEDEAGNRPTEITVGTKIRIVAILRTWGGEGLGGKTVNAGEKAPDGTIRAIPLTETPPYVGLYRAWRTPNMEGEFIYWAYFAGDAEFAGCEEELEAGVGDFRW